MFEDYQHKKAYSHIFDYKRNIDLVTNQLRIALRPFVLAISGSTDLARHTRAMGEKAGFTFPEEPAKVSMLGPTPVLDYLTPATSDFLPLPILMSPTEGVEGLDPVSVRLSIINANMDVILTLIAEYREKATNLFLEL